MMRRNLLFAIAIGLATVGSGGVAWSADADQAALLKALPGAKVTLEQGIAQVAKGSEVPTEGGVRRPQAHRPVGAVPHSAVDDQIDDPGDHQQGGGRRHGLFGERENSQRQARF